METDSICLLLFALLKAKHDNFSWTFPSPSSLPPRVVYCDKSYKKLHSCHFSRNESSRKIFLRHHCQSCESLWGKRKRKRREKGREKKIKLVNRAILDLYSEKSENVELNLINEEKKDVELNETKKRDFDSYIFNNMLKWRLVASFVDFLFK